MNLEDLISMLEADDPAKVLPHGFTNPHSYRGDPYELAFEPVADVTVADMLSAARSALGATFEGWKGGKFTMYGYTWCWLSLEGDSSGETISRDFLALMLAAGSVPQPEHADRGRDASRALTEVRTVLSRAETARKAIEGPTEYHRLDPPERGCHIDASKPRFEDQDAADMRTALDQVITLLARWRKTGRSTKSTPLA